jgi:hypothetical protein
MRDQSKQKSTKNRLKCRRMALKAKQNNGELVGETDSTKAGNRVGLGHGSVGRRYSATSVRSFSAGSDATIVLRP